MTKRSPRTRASRRVTRPAVETTDGPVIDGIKLVRLTGVRIDASNERDLDYPYTLEVNLSPPELMQVAFIMLHGGSEEIIVRGKTRGTIDQFIALHDLRRHPRLRRMTITGPNALREEFKP